MMKKLREHWRDAVKERPRPDSSIIIDDSGNIHRCIYDYEKKTIGSAVVETTNGYEAVLIKFEWHQVLKWAYVEEVELVSME